MLCQSDCSIGLKQFFTITSPPSTIVTGFLHYLASFMTDGTSSAVIPKYVLLTFTKNVRVHYNNFNLFKYIPVLPCAKHNI